MTFAIVGAVLGLAFWLVIIWASTRDLNRPAITTRRVTPAPGGSSGPDAYGLAQQELADRFRRRSAERGDRP